MFEWAVHYHDIVDGRQCLDTYPTEREARANFTSLRQRPNHYREVTLLKRGPMPPWKPTR